MFYAQVWGVLDFHWQFSCIPALSWQSTAGFELCIEIPYCPKPVSQVLIADAVRAGVEVARSADRARAVDRRG